MEKLESTGKSLGFSLAVAALAVAIGAMPVAWCFAELASPATLNALQQFINNQLAGSIGPVDWNQVAEMARQLGFDPRTIDSAVRVLGGGGALLDKDVLNAVAQAHAGLVTLFWVLIVVGAFAAFACFLLGGVQRGIGALASTLAVVGLASFIIWGVFAGLDVEKEPLAVHVKSSLAHVTGLFAFLLIALAACALAAFFVLKPRAARKPLKVKV